MKSAEFLDLRKKETLEIIEAVNTIFELLDDASFNKKPSMEKWSIGECFQHLNLTLNIYIPQMMELVEQKEIYPKHTDTFSHSFLGKIAVKSMTPKKDSTIPYKMKTFGDLKPLKTHGGQKSILDDFLAFQEDILYMITALSDMSLTKPKITTAAGKWLKMGIGDALHFMVAHNQRHLQQAQNVLKIIT